VFVRKVEEVGAESYSSYSSWGPMSCSTSLHSTHTMSAYLLEQIFHVFNGAIKQTQQKSL
jgi:hypothetical protein